VSSRTFKIGHDKVEGEDVKGWEEWLNHQMKQVWGIDRTVPVDGVYTNIDRAMTASVCHGLGLVASEAMANGVTPELRVKLRNKRLSLVELARYHGPRRLWRLAQKRKYDGGGVSLPVGKITVDSWGWVPGVHDGIDINCPPRSPLLAVCRARVVRAAGSGWWGLGNPGGATGAAGDGIIIIQSLVDAGPIRKGDCFGYGHAEHPVVNVGDVVEAGEPIGRAGLAVTWHTHWMLNRGLYSASKGKGDTDPRKALDYLKRNA
jgi:murein DD-endopeptidase MepM/ murein hydrolase activator NlpD